MVLSKRIVSNQPDEKPEVFDEGWWSSVMADEEALHSNSSESLKPPGVNHAEGVDWDRVQELFERDEIITMEVYGCNRGGLLVQSDIFQGFVPVSHLIDIPATIDDQDERQDRLSRYLNRQLQLKVIECEPSLDRIVLSERAAQAGEGKRKQLFDSLKVGEHVNGIVTNVTDFGAFVDLGGVEGLIHVSELSWGRVQHPSDILRVGQCVETLVLQVNEENARVALSLKRLCANPWETLVENRKPGELVSATITTIMRFGAFARLEEGVEGLIHISSIDRDKTNFHSLEEFFHPGQIVQVRILHIDAGRRRLGLGLVING